MNIFRTCLLFGAIFYKITCVRVENALSITKDQMQELAGNICDEYFYGNKAAVTICNRNFIKALEDSTKFLEPPPATLRCQTKKRITVKVLASGDYDQLVVIVPDREDSIVKTAVYYKNETLKDISTAFGGRIWSSYLDKDGIPLGWVPGDLVPEWTQPEKRPYFIEFDNFEMRNNSGRVDVVFRWNSSDAADSCFSVRNQCDKLEMGNIQHSDIKPNNPKVFLVNDLKLDDNCRVTVSGKYGVSTLEYKTPSCENYEDSCPPENADIVITSTRSYSGVGWDVTVGWQKPRRAPIRYNITLRANRTYTATVPGNIRSVTFPGVVGDRKLNVTVAAVGKTDTAYSNTGAFLTPIEESTSIAMVVGGAWAALLLVTVVAMLLYVFLQRRRRDKLRSIYFPDLDYKSSKEGSSETFSTEVTLAEDHWELRSERLLLHEVIGEGAFGVVRRATLAPGGKEVAVKMLKEFPSVEEIRSFRCEMEVMKSVGAHPHVVSLLGCCSGHRPYIVAEYCQKGNLLNFLRCAWDIISLKRTAKYYNNNIEFATDYRDDLFKPKTYSEHSQIVVNKLYDLQKLCDMELTAVDLLSFCRQIAMGMEFLASNRVVHRDLAARNVLVTSDKTLKIADFGLSRDVYQENQYKQKGLGKLPIKWMALESLTQRIYTTQSDVWSFGVVIWEVVTVGGSPYQGVPASRLPRLLRAGYRMPKPTNCSKQLYDIMLSCWNSRPRDRPTFGELHRAFDALLNCACADEYLSLELDVEDVPPPPSISKYFALIPRRNRYGCRKQSYERPLKSIQSNHYTSPPASQPRTQLV